ncbi:MAG: tetratricopeptide repeat protein, partial [Propionibacteriales bacterium]|nr:tetratricopeptide repeat protein [Propionibacteriales bacterium]
MLTASELHRRGLEASNAARYERARSTFRQAIERSDDVEQIAHILLSLAHVESELGSRREGLALCDQALALRGVASSVVGLIHSQRGLLLTRSGAGAAALSAYTKALATLGSDPEPRMRVHLNRGNVYLQRGDGARASRDFALAVGCAEAANLPVQKAKAEHNLGCAYLLVGDLVSALQLMDRARAVLAPLSRVSDAVGQQDRAEVLLASGMTQESSTALRAAATAFGENGLRQQQAEAELVLARLLLLDSPKEAARVARRARQRFAARGSHVWAVRAQSVVVAGELDSRQSAQQLERADDLVCELREHGLDKEASGLAVRAAQALAGRGQWDEACAQLGRAKVSRRSALATRLLAREVQATVAQGKGRRVDAVHHLRKGLAELHAWQSSFGSLDLQSSLVGHGRGLALQGLSLAIRDGRPEVIFEWSERARALASRVTPVRPPSNERAADDLAALRRVQADIDDRPSGADPALLRHAAELTRRIRQRAWYDVGSGLVTEPVALEEMAAELSTADGALLSYLVVDDHIHVLAVAGGRSHVSAVGSFGDVRAFLDGMQADLDMAAADMPAVMRTAIRASLAQRLDLLDARLVQPLRGVLADRPVVIVPSGSLAGVPWSLLPGLTGRPLTVPRSASSWLHVGRSQPAAGVAGADATAGFVAG